MYVLVPFNMTTHVTFWVHGLLAIEMPEAIESYNGFYITVFKLLVVLQQRRTMLTTGFASGLVTEPSYSLTSF